MTAKKKKARKVKTLRGKTLSAKQAKAVKGGGAGAAFFEKVGSDH